MPSFLCFTPDDYQAIARVCQPLPIRGGYAEFQRFVMEGLQTTHPVLAQRIAGLRLRQIRILREHLDRRQAEPRREDAGSDSAGADLSVHEWLVVSRVCGLILLRVNLHCKGRLLEEVAEVSPSLADKLAGFSQHQIDRLYRRVRSGRRWCP